MNEELLSWLKEFSAYLPPLEEEEDRDEFGCRSQEWMEGAAEDFLESHPDCPFNARYLVKQFYLVQGVKR